MKLTNLFFSIFEFIIGLGAIFGYIVMFISKEENMVKWTITLLLAIYFFIKGIYGIIKYFKK